MTIVELEQCIDQYGKDIYSFCRYATGSIQEGGRIISGYLFEGGRAYGEGGCKPES